MAPLRGLIESPKGDCFIYMLSCKTTQLGHYIKHQHTDKRSINVFPRPQRQSSQLNSYPAFYPQIPNTVLGQTTDISFQVPANRQFKVPFLCHIHHHWNTKFFYHKKQRLVNKPSIVTWLTVKRPEQLGRCVIQITGQKLRNLGSVRDRDNKFFSSPDWLRGKYSPILNTSQGIFSRGLDEGEENGGA